MPALSDSSSASSAAFWSINSPTRQRTLARSLRGQSLPDTRLGSLLRTRNRIVDRFGAAVLELGDLLFGGGIENRNHLTGAGSFTDLIQHSPAPSWVSLLAALRVSYMDGSACDHRRAVGYALNHRCVDLSRDSWRWTPKPWSATSRRARSAGRYPSAPEAMGRHIPVR